MSLDSVSSQQKAPSHTPTSAPQVIGTRWAVAAGHPLASAAASRVPAAPDAWCTALERWGTMSFADVALAATEHAERGFAVSPFSAYQMGANADKYKRWPSSAALYLRDGRAYRTGEVLVQRELGETLRRMMRAIISSNSVKASFLNSTSGSF